jgi:hypothetical protein
MYDVLLSRPTMTPAQFLAMEVPGDHPDFLGCDEETNHEGVSVLVPHLVELVKRIGGPGEIPPPPMRRHVSDWDSVLIADFNRFGNPRDERHDFNVRLRSLSTGFTFVAIECYGDGVLVFDGWHPTGEIVSIFFVLPDNWEVEPWQIGHTSVMDWAAPQKLVHLK